MVTLDEITAKLRLTSPRHAGLLGENLARAWLDACGWEYLPVDQSADTLAIEVREHCAKRPDFIAKVSDGSIVALDAKFHATPNSTFRLTDDELKQYRNLRNFLGHIGAARADVLFMLFPKEHEGRLMTFVGLDEVLGGEISELGGSVARAISIKDRLTDTGLTFSLDVQSLMQ